jgi:hypothetical protein
VGCLALISIRLVQAVLWFLFWTVIAVAVGLYCLYSLQLTINQKKAWKAFSKKYKLTYKETSFYAPPGFFGKINDQLVMAYVEGERNSFPGRGGFWSVIEAPFSSPLREHALVMVSPNYKHEVMENDALKPFSPESLAWKKEDMLYSDAPDFFRSYMGKENLMSLAALREMKKGDYIFVLDGEDSVVSYRSKRPLDNPAELNKIVKILLEIARVWSAPEKSSSMVSAEKSKIEGSLAFEDDQ